MANSEKKNISAAAKASAPAEPAPDAARKAAFFAEAAAYRTGDRETFSVDATATPPALGALAHVRVADGLQLVNNETGAFFLPGVATPVTTTITLLRRLQDGDLVLAPSPL